jgi:hypothetical protein
MLNLDGTMKKIVVNVFGYEIFNVSNKNANI